MCMEMCVLAIHMHTKPGPNHRDLTTRTKPPGWWAMRGCTTAVMRALLSRSPAHVGALRLNNSQNRNNRRHRRHRHNRTTGTPEQPAQSTHPSGNYARRPQIPHGGPHLRYLCALRAMLVPRVRPGTKRAGPSHRCVSRLALYCRRICKLRRV